MGIQSNPILCDGCGLQASPEHIAERLSRLEVATRFRPIHINTLLVALAPMEGIENDFYGPPVANDFFDSMMDRTEIAAPPEKLSSDANKNEIDAVKLAEFQHKGFYVGYLSECPIPDNPEAADAAISRLGMNLIRRIRFNYKPRQVVFLGNKLARLIEILESAGLAHLVQLEASQSVETPESSNVSSGQVFQKGMTPS